MATEKPRELRELAAEELGDALALVWDSFRRSVAHEVSDEGIDDFWRSIEYEYMLHRMGDGQVRFWGALENGGLVGVCAIWELSRVTLLFVAPKHQRRGVGSALLKRAVADCKARDGSLGRITLGALPGSVEFFERLGFRAVGTADTEDSLRAVPMEVIGAEA